MDIGYRTLVISVVLNSHRSFQDTEDGCFNTTQMCISENRYGNIGKAMIPVNQSGIQATCRSMHLQSLVKMDIHCFKEYTRIVDGHRTAMEQTQ